MTGFRFHHARAAACSLFLLSGPVLAGPDPAALFDEGVRRFAKADYEGAAGAFLRADEAAPSVQALLNAIGAGRRGHAHLLVARASQRALARTGASEELLRLAREALTESATHLARIDVSCAPAANVGAGRAARTAPGAADEPCAIAIDGAPVDAGTHYVLPGTRRFTASLAGGAPDEQPLTCNAGATYTVVMRPAGPSIAAPSATSIAKAAPDSSPGWPPAVVYAGAGLTAALAGVTVWSGVDALEAKSALPAVPLRAQNEDVLARAHRTDGLVAGTIVAGLATAAAAIWLVSWDRSGAPTKTTTTGTAKASIGVAPSSDGVSAIVRGRF